MSNEKRRDYEPEFKENILRLHLEEGRTINSLTKEYDLVKGTLSSWLQQLRKECRTNNELRNQVDIYEENKRLRLELAEKEKEIDFLKKAAAFFAKETSL